MNDFRVSVIIPVYNGERYIKEAIESANGLEEVGEVIVIDDGSLDTTYSIIQKLKNNLQKVKLLTHSDRKNHGRSASRNLGIKEALCEYISFLDADDKYLPNRFHTDKKLFISDSSIEGVYGATIAEFESKKAEELFRRRFTNDLSTLKKPIEPHQLLQTLLFGNVGHFTTDAITVKKTIFRKSGFFDEKLYLGEDTHLWYRMAATSKLVAGSIIEPIAQRRVHENNSIHTEKKVLETQFFQMYTSLFKWAISAKICYDYKNLLFLAYYSFSTSKSSSERKILIEFILRNPLIIFNTFVWRKTKQLMFK